MNEYEKKNRERLLRILAKIQDAECPYGWKAVCDVGVGGLTEIGFSKSSAYLLVVSDSGRGVFDCRTGARVARDDNDDGDWLDQVGLTCMGIGPVDGEKVSLAGLHGGGLPLVTRQGELLEMLAPEWPLKEIYFCEGQGSPYMDGRQHLCRRIFRGHPVRACGFSPDGNVFAIATSSDLKMFTRRET